MQHTKSNVDELLRAAITEKRLIRLRYGNRDRIVEPHHYGITNGSAKLLGYQLGGSSTRELPNWRWMKTDLISDLQLLNETFPGGRATSSGKPHQWDRLFIRVRPAGKNATPASPRQKTTASALEDCVNSDSGSIAAALAELGYPRFHRRHDTAKKNPATVLLAAISTDELEVRVLEALPWLAVEYYDLDWDWLLNRVQQRNVQNRLGFIVTLACRIAKASGLRGPATRLQHIERTLRRTRGAEEDTLCQSSLMAAEREWLRSQRSETARFWNLLTDLDFEASLYEA